MHKLNYLDDVHEDFIIREADNVGFVFLHDQEICLLGFVVIDAVDAGPFCFCDVFPHPIVDFDHMAHFPLEVFYCNCLGITFSVAVEDGAELWAFNFVVFDCTEY